MRTRGLTLASFGCVLVSIAWLAAGCGGGGSSGAVQGQTGFIDVRMTDAPFPVSCFAEATVVVDRIEIQSSGSQDDGGWTVVTATSQVYNLLDLAGGVSQNAAFAQVPAGRYHQVRLFVSSAILTWADGSGFQREFKIPSDVVKINPKPHIVIVPGMTTGLMLDFDLSRSFVQQGPPAATCEELKQANSISFKPVVRATNVEASGVVAGTVTDGANGGVPFAGVTVSADDGVNPVVSTISADGTTGPDPGSYALLLDPGTYTITFEAPGRTPVAFPGIGVATGSVTTLDASIP